MTGLNTRALADFRAGFTGNVLLPGDAGYDDARTVYNVMIDRRPSVIAQCENVEDVSRAIRFGQESDREIAVRGGGHGVAGKALSDGGIVIDLRRMHSVTVDPEARTARVDGGALMTHLDRATQPYGLATTGGRVSSTGVAGYTLSGGSGWLERKYGLTCARRSRTAWPRPGAGSPPPVSRATRSAAGPAGWNASTG